MEWKNIRKWLLLMLLVVDVFLAGNLIHQVERNRSAERQALLDAVTVCARRGVTLDSDALLDLPVELNAWNAVRSDALEQAAADALLGQGTKPEGLGGGVSIFRGAQGQLSFRRGGNLELDLAWAGETPDREACAVLLSPAGIKVDEAMAYPIQGGMELVQRHQGAPIVNSRLTCVVQEDTLHIRGRWLLDSEAAQATVSLSRAQLTLSLGSLLEGRQGAVSVTAAYYLQGEDARALTLVPVWVVRVGETELLLNCLTGEELHF